jgi:hypothetical protein
VNVAVDDENAFHAIVPHGHVAAYRNVLSRGEGGIGNEESGLGVQTLPNAVPKMPQIPSVLVRRDKVLIVGSM